MTTMTMTRPETETTQADRERAEAVARGRADVVAGRVVPHADVRAWLLSWGTANELPRPQPKCR